MGCKGVVVLAIIGLGLFFYGWREWRLSRNASAQPEAITMTELEKGPPTNPYRTLGEHKPFLALVVYQTDKKKQERVDFAYYPVMTQEEMEAVLNKLAEKHGGDTDKITDDEFKKALDIKVLIKTEQYKTVTDLKNAIDKKTIPTKDVTGMVTNEVDSIGSAQADMLKQQFPSFDKEKVVIFEQGRTPSSTGAAFGFMGAGAVVFLVGIVMMFVGGRKTAA